MPIVRKIIRLLKDLGLFLIIPPLSLMASNLLPGIIQIGAFGVEFYICERDILEKELYVRGLLNQVSIELLEIFNLGVEELEASQSEQASLTFEGLTETPLKVTVALYVNLGVAYSLSGRLKKGLKATKKAEKKIAYLIPALEEVLFIAIKENKDNIQALKEQL